MSTDHSQKRGSTRLDGDPTRADTLPIPPRASEKDRQRIEHVNRNLKIRAAYPQLRDKYCRGKAFQMLADKHNVEPATVKAIVYGQR